MPVIKLTFDKRAFATAIQKKILVSKRTAAEIINKALLNVAYRAAQFTPKSSVQKINSITTEVLAKLASTALKKKQGKFTKKEHKLYMTRIMKARRARIAALRVGWKPAIEKLGGTFRGGKSKAVSTVDAGTAMKAIPSKLYGLIANTIVTRSSDGKHSADEISVSIAGLEEAIRFVTLDMENHAREQLEKALVKLND